MKDPVMAEGRSLSECLFVCLFITKLKLLQAN